MRKFKITQNNISIFCFFNDCNKFENFLKENYTGVITIEEIF